MNIGFKFGNMAVLIEFLVAAGLGLFFHWVLHDREAALIIFGTGILLSLSTHLLREELGNAREKLLTNYRQSHEITFAMARISDPECREKAHQVLNSLKRTITTLQQGYIPLGETEFRMMAAKAVEHSTSRVKSVEPLTAGWDLRGAVMNYYRSNLRALRRGVRIRRIFVVNRNDFFIPEIQKVLVTQLRDGIDVRVAFNDELPPAGDSTWAGYCSFNFAVFDDREATEVFANGNYFGRKTSQPSVVDRFLRIFELIEHNTHKLAIQDENVTLRGGAEFQAASY